jgi:hypothetical protein
VRDWVACGQFFSFQSMHSTISPLAGCIHLATMIADWTGVAAMSGRRNAELNWPWTGCSLVIDNNTIETNMSSLLASQKS